MKLLLSLACKGNYGGHSRVLHKKMGIRMYSQPPESTTPGAGAGKGGGAGGSIKEAGGGLGKFGAAQEEGYFYKLTREQLKKFKKKFMGEGDETKSDENDKKSDANEKK